MAAIAWLTHITIARRTLAKACRRWFNWVITSLIDNNRDGLLAWRWRVPHQMKTFLEYHPTILHDLHESCLSVHVDRNRSFLQTPGWTSDRESMNGTWLAYQKSRDDQTRRGGVDSTVSHAGATLSVSLRDWSSLRFS